MYAPIIHGLGMSLSHKAKDALFAEGQADGYKSNADEKAKLLEHDDVKHDPNLLALATLQYNECRKEAEQWRARAAKARRLADAETATTSTSTGYRTRSTTKAGASQPSTTADDTSTTSHLSSF